MPTPLRNAWRRPRNLPLAKLAAGYVADVSDVPFRTSIAPSVGSTPTLTRALAATVVDHEGIVRTAKSGELRFSGLRRVENLVSSSQDMTTGSWSRVGSTVVKNAALAPDGSMTANLLTGSVNGNVAVYTVSITVVPNSRYILFAHFKPGTSALHLLSVSDNVNSGCNLYFNAVTNALVISAPFGGWGYTSSTVTVLNDGWVHISALLTSNSDDLVTTVYACGCETTASGQVVGKTCLVWGVQLENVTGQAVQTSSEYVSNGVLSAPFHGAGVDGVKYFNTRRLANLLVKSQELDNAVWTKDVNTSVTANVTATLAPDGTYTADKKVEATTATADRLVYQTPLTPILPGSTNYVSISVKAAERGYAQVRLGNGNGTFCTLIASVNLTTGAVTASSAIGGSTLKVATSTADNYGFWRVVVGGELLPNVTLANLQVYSLDTGGTTTNFAGVVGYGFYMWGAHLGPDPGYIPTTDSPVSIEGPTLDPLTTNAVRNNTMVGAVAGTPGTVPTNWSYSSVAGLTFSVVGSGVEDGINYLDVRWVGTTSSSGGIGVLSEPSTSVAAVIGQTWVSSAFVRLMAGSLANCAFGVGINEVNSGNTYLTGSNQSITPDSRPLGQSRSFATRLLTNASTAAVHQYVYSPVSSGVAIDVTLRVGMPQLQKLEYPTPVIPTTGAAASAAIAGFPRCFVEPSRINKVRNNTMAGAVAGVSLPNLWAVSAPVGIVGNLQAVGVEDGVNYIEFRFNGICTTVGSIVFYTETAAVATTGQVWTHSAYVYKFAGSLSNTNWCIGVEERTSDNAWLTKNYSALPMTATQMRNARAGHTRTLNQATTGQIRSFVYTVIALNAVVDVTIRIGMPQLEQASVMSSVIPTSGAEVTRPADVLTHPISVGNTGTWVVTVSPGEVPASAGLYPMVSLQVVHAVNQIGLFMQPGASTLGLSVFTNGVQLVYGSIQSSVVAGGVYRVALSWSAANRRISYCVNGGTPGAVTGVNMPQALTSFSTAAGNPWIGTVSDSEIFTVEHPPETLKLMSAL